jgi:hypothetical protein
VGKCFNCLSAGHLATQCRRKTRCFRCLSQGHRSYVCAKMLGCGGAMMPERAPVWRRITPASSSPGANPCNSSPAVEASGTATPLDRPLCLVGGANTARATGAASGVWRRKSLVQVPTGANPGNVFLAGEVSIHLAAGGAVAPRSGAGIGDGMRRPRRRCRPRFRQPPGSSSAGNPAPSVSTSVAPPEARVSPVQHPPCIISWNDHVARAEEDLTHAVIVTVCGANHLAPAREAAEVVAARLGVDAGSLVLHQSSISSYILVLPEVTLVERLVDLRQPPLCSPAFTLLCKRWS